MQYIQRDIDKELTAWAKLPAQKPLLLRGARQVGKTSTVRALAGRFAHTVEIDMNEPGPARGLFESELPVEALWENLCALAGIPNRPRSALLFIDEIQACPAAINRLRYFHERLPDLHVIAAGSLLEFALESLPSFGVGRIRSIFLYPMSFAEFLRALGKDALLAILDRAGPEAPLPAAIHEALSGHLRAFLAMGGMPEVVSAWCGRHDYLACQRVLDDLLLSYEDDFKKYASRVPGERVAEVFRSVARQGEGKFVYARAGEGLKTREVKGALRLLILAGLVRPVTHTAANGLPLGSEANEKYSRMILMDTGFVRRLLGLPLRDFLCADGLKAVNRGAIAEIFVGMELLKAADPYCPQSLYCWHRETKDSQASVDYVVQRGAGIIPIEVKSGGRGSMQSLRLFMEQKGLALGVRTALENFSSYENIQVYPLYAIRNLLNRAA